MIFTSKKFIFCSLGVLLLLAVVLYLTEPPKVLVIERDLAMRQAPNWDSRLDGIKIALISDLHLTKSFFDSGVPQQVQARANAAEADLIFILGDVIQTHARPQNQPTIDEITQYLHGFRSKLGTFVIYGNHEGGSRRYRGKADPYNRFFNSPPLTLLDYQTHEVKYNDANIRLAGGYHPAWVLPENPKKLPTIILSHDPQLFEASTPDAMLSVAGHMHGGQLRLWGFSPLTLLVDFDRGLYYTSNTEGQQRMLYVTSGAGLGFPYFRMGCPPEVVILTLCDR